MNYQVGDLVYIKFNETDLVEATIVEVIKEGEAWYVFAPRRKSWHSSRWWKCYPKHLKPRYEPGSFEEAINGPDVVTVE